MEFLLILVFALPLVVGNRLIILVVLPQQINQLLALLPAPCLPLGSLYHQRSRSCRFGQIPLKPKLLLHFLYFLTQLLNNQVFFVYLPFHLCNPPPLLLQHFMALHVAGGIGQIVLRFCGDRRDDGGRDDGGRTFGSDLVGLNDVGNGDVVIFKPDCLQGLEVGLLEVGNSFNALAIEVAIHNVVHYFFFGTAILLHEEQQQMLEAFFFYLVQLKIVLAFLQSSQFI